jgi:uncharacterized protein YpmB
MRTFERKRDKRSIWESRPVLIILGLIVVIFAWSVIRFWNKMRETGRNLDLVEERAAALEEQKDTLVKDIENLSTLRGKEEFFRSNYGLAKEGEEVIIVVEDQTPPPAPKPGGLGGLWNSFKNLFK